MGDQVGDAAAFGLGAGVLSGTCSFPAVWVQAEGLAEWGGQEHQTCLRKGLKEAGERMRQVHLEGRICARTPLLPCWPPGIELESRLAPGGLGTLPCPAGCSGHSRATCCRSAIQESPPGLATLGSNGCRELPSPALGPGKREGILGGALGPQPFQPRILALKGTLDTEGAARPAQDVAKAWALVVLRLDQGQGPSCSPGRQPS